jgi:CPA2 family monovalent cation:H+ antiporter-2
MEADHILINVIILIGVAVFVVSTLKRLNISPVIGYLIAGTVIGDHGFKIITYSQTKMLGELGVVFLLFAIGLELSISRLIAMKKYVFGLGSFQVITTSIVIASGYALISGNNSVGIIIGGGLALSSTAIVMQVIEETRSQSTQIGRIALAILLLQDLAVVPLLVIVPLLAGTGTTSLASALGLAFVKAVIALLAIFIAGRLFLRPLFGMISYDNGDNSELPISMTLLVVLSAAWATEYFGLSLALGAFVAGILVAETDFRVQAEESIYPFKSLFLGLFFMTVGMNIDVIEIYNQLSTIITFSIALIFVKSFIITCFCILFKFSKGVSIHAGLLLSQGSEFAFVLFGLGKETGVIPENTANLLFLIVACTMASTPLIAALGQKLSEKIDNIIQKSPLDVLEFGTRDLTNHVIIGGFGSIGRMISRILEAQGLNYVILDVNDEIVNAERANNLPIFKGDICQVGTLQAVGMEKALAVVLTMNNQVTVKKSLKTINNYYPDLKTILRLKNLDNAREFYDSGADIIIPENYETGLQIGGAILKSVGVSENDINRIKSQFRSGNYVSTVRILESEEDE